MPPTQEGRFLTLATPLGADVLLLERLTGTEELSGLFQFELDALCPVDQAGWAFDQLLGKSTTAKILLADGSFRYFNGIVSRIHQGGNLRGPGTDMRRYRIVLVPKTWLLTLRVQSRIFQQLAVPDILKTVLTGLSVSWQLTGTYEPRDYCTQYRESDWAFACRLMEEEGIYYYFKHSDGNHEMVVSDSPESHVDVPGPTTVKYHDVEGGLQPEDRIYSWQKSQEIRPSKVTLWDHCFELPGQNLHATTPSLQSIGIGNANHKLTGIGNDALEVYEFPGRYAQRFDGVAPGGGDRASDVQKIFKDNSRTADIAMRRQETPAVIIHAEGNVRHLTAGHKFTLSDHFDANGEFVLTRVEHDAGQEGFASGSNVPDHYSCRFRCIPIALPFAPPLMTPRPQITGPQTAEVVGPSGEEIFTDKYGRVKVQFHWDRDGKKDAGSSCWVRVGSFWAGKQWGGIHIPRIGQEVIVSFEEGDPDRPIIVGSVYNADNMPPYTLPDNKTQSGIKSRSSLKGTDENFNELRFEDKKDEEEIYFHAEKNFNRVVENNDTLKVGFEKKDKGDQTIEIFNNQSLAVGKGTTEAADGSQTIDIFNNQTLTVGSGKGQNADGSQTISVYKNRTTTIETGDETLTVKQGKRTVQVDTGDDTHTVKTGNRVVNVDTGNDTHTVKTGNRSVEVSLGNDSLTIKTGNQTTKLDVGKSTTEALQSIELKVGPSSIKIEMSGITLQAPTIKVQGSAQVQIQGPMTQVSGDATLMLKGGVIMIG